MENRAIIGTTRHDTTRHDTTRHDTTRHDTTPIIAPLRVAVIGSSSGAAYVVESLGKSIKYSCRVAVAEDYPGKNFVRCLSRLNFKKKLKQIVRSIRTRRSVKGHGGKFLCKVPEVYFTSPDIMMRSFSMIPKKVFEDIDLFLLVCDDKDTQDLRLVYKSSDYVSELMRHGIAKEKIFIVPPVMYQADLPLLEGDELSPLCRNMNEVKPLLRYMEYHVTDFCNLKCKGCSHLANYVKELEFGGAEKFRLSLAKLAEKFRNITVIRLLGGEPLLCRELHEYIYTAHEIFPYSQIKIVTNGLLYKNMTKETIEAVRTTGAEIEVTQYPPTRKIAEEIVTFCEQNGMKLYISEAVREFAKRVVSGSGADYFRKCWLSCSSRYCHLLRGTTLYLCSRIWTVHEQKFRDAVMKKNPDDKEYTYNFISEGITEDEYREYSYDLLQDIEADGWDILAKIENPMEICRKCGDKLSFFKWESELPQYNE